MSWTGLDSTLRQPSRNRRRVETKQRAPLDAVRDPIRSATSRRTCPTTQRCLATSVMCMRFGT